jgi:hypothetical protein
MNVAPWTGPESLLHISRHAVRVAPKIGTHESEACAGLGALKFPA